MRGVVADDVKTAVQGLAKFRFYVFFFFFSFYSGDG